MLVVKVHFVRSFRVSGGACVNMCVFFFVMCNTVCDYVFELLGDF